MISGELITKYFIKGIFNFIFIVIMLASDNVRTAEWIFMKFYEVLRKFVRLLNSGQNSKSNWTFTNTCVSFSAFLRHS